MDIIPEETEEGVLYVSLKYCTAIHRCPCGSGHEVVTPISPSDWQLTFDGRSVSLYPSIGNYNLQCKSHYWISNNMVRKARNWSDWIIRSDNKKGETKKGRFA